MRVYFRKTGGFAATFIGCQIDTTENPGPEAAELESLIQSSGIMKLSDKRVQNARDVFLYTFEIEDKGKVHRVTLDQLSIPEEVSPLLDFCLSRSKSMMPD